MRSTLPKLRHHPVLVTLGAVVLSVAIGVWGWFHEDHRLRKVLAVRAAEGALFFSPEELRPLHQTAADEKEPAYQAVKSRLMRMRRIYEDARYLYLMHYDPADGHAHFIADSAEPGSEDESHPGELYPEAPLMPGLLTTLRLGRPAVEGPLSDSFGTFVTGYAMVDGEGGLTVFGVDIEVGDWRRQLLMGALRFVGLCWVVVMGPLLLFVWFRQRMASGALIRKLGGAVEQSGSAIVILGTDSRIEHVNEGLCQQTGYKREEVVGRDWRELQHDATPSAVTSRILEEARGGRSWEGEIVNRRRNGEFYPARATLTPLRGPSGRIEGFVVVFVDISDAQRKQNELREAKERAEHADEAKGRFLATMSHEVRTPLNGIVGFTNLLLGTSLSTEQREYVQTIRTSGEALVHLTSDILDFSRIETGRVQLDPAPCDLRATIEDVLDIFAARAVDQGIALLHSVDPDVPEQVVLDGGRLRQVMINLVSNAVKFTASGEVEVTARLLTGKSVSVAPFDDVARGQLVAELDDGGLTVEVSVRDTGVGISEDDGRRLFQPFTQLDGSASRRYGGAGLGLVISRELVRLMGGDIRLESEPGSGSVFIFTVRARPSGSRTRQGVPALSGRRVALVAAHDGLRAELAQLLREEGAAVTLPAPGSPLLEGSELVVVDCDDRAVVALVEGSQKPQWAPSNSIGTVDVTVPGETRRALRQHFRMLLNKPVHHRTLVDVLVKTAQSSGQLGSGLRALVIEDDPVQQRLSVGILETLGCQCQTAAGGEAGIAELAARDYDLVLMDLLMEGVDGVTSIKRIRAGAAGAARKEVWIVAITSDQRSEVRDMALQAGANDHLVKPVGIVGFEEVLNRFLSMRKTIVGA